MGEQSLAYALFPHFIIGYLRQITGFAPTNGNTIAISHLFPVISRFKSARSNTPVAVWSSAVSLIYHEGQIIHRDIQQTCKSDKTSGSQVASFTFWRKL